MRLPYLNRLSPGMTFALAAVGVAAVGGVDFLTGTEIRVHPLYYLPVALAAWRTRAWGGVLISILAAATWAISNRLAGQHYSNAAIWGANLGTQALSFAVIALLISEVRGRLEAERDLSRIDALTALPNVRAFREQGVSAAERSVLPPSRSSISTTSRR